MATKKKKGKAVESVKTKPRLARTAKPPVRKTARKRAGRIQHGQPVVGNMAPLAGMFPYLANFDYVKELREMRDEWDR